MLWVLTWVGIIIHIANEGGHVRIMKYIYRNNWLAGKLVLIYIILFTKLKIYLLGIWIRGDNFKQKLYKVKTDAVFHQS